MILWESGFLWRVLCPLLVLVTWPASSLSACSSVNWSYPKRIQKVFFPFNFLVSHFTWAFKAFSDLSAYMSQQVRGEVPLEGVELEVITLETQTLGQDLQVTVPEGV